MTEPLIASIDSETRQLFCNIVDGSQSFEVELDCIPNAIAFSTAEIVVGGEDPNQICIFDFSGPHIQTIDTASVPISVAFHRSGLKFACGFDRGRIGTYHKHDDIWSKTKRWKASNQPIEGLFWINDDEICAGSQDAAIITWNAESGEKSNIIQSEDMNLLLWSLSQMSDDDCFMFSAYADGAVRKHNLVEGSTTELKAHSEGVGCIRIHNDMFVTCGDDCSVAAFDIETLTEKWRYQCVQHPTSVAIVNEEVFVGVYGSFVVVLNVNTGEFVRQFSMKCEGYVILAVQSVDYPFARFKFED